jgi:hypothetical protein
MEMNVLNTVSQAISFLDQTQLKKKGLCLMKILVATLQPHSGT